MTEYETMTYERKDRIAYIMFNRPQSLNAVNRQFEEDLHEALLEFDTDDEAWVGIIHGAGRAFCAGAGHQAALRGDDPAGERPAGARPQPGGLPGPHRQLGSRSSPPCTGTPWVPASSSPPSAT